MIRKMSKPAMRRFLFFFGFMILLTAGPGLIHSKEAKKAKETGAKIFDQLKYRHVGPVGNRVSTVTGVPGDPNTIYAGAASGGVFKSSDGGINWTPVFDKQPVSSIGALVVAPSDTNVLWVGTGETFIRSNVSQGNGIYKSTDRGKSFKHMGLEKTGRIGRIVIDPRNPDIVLAAAMGHCYGPQQERGVYRTEDGGKTWKRVLFVDENTGCSDIAIDPNNPRILFAGMWPMLIKTWGKWSGGPGGGLYMSRDGGLTWKQLKGSGLPETEMGKVAVSVAPSNSDRVYAMIETRDEGLWRSDNGGQSWKHISHNRALLNRPLYYTRCIVSPDNYNEVYFPATRFHMTLDGGETIKRFNPAGGDHHDMWIDPTNPDRMIVGNDQVVAISTNRGKSWHGVQLPVAQMYHVYTDNRIPYYVYGNRQDGTSYRGPSNSRTGRRIPSGLWHPVGGFESGFAVPDPVDNNIVWSGNYDGMLDRFDLRTGQSRAVDVWPEGIQCWAPADVKFRFQWTFPIVVSPHDHNKVYVGSQHVHMTTNGGHSWTLISPDLSTNDKSKQQYSGGITIDDTGPLFSCTIFALAESPVRAGVLWAGTNDGLLQVSKDGGASWKNVTKNLPGLPPWGTFSNIEPSRFDAGTCYVTVDLHQVNNRDPFVYKTDNFGEKWQPLHGDIPKSELSYAHCVREDPVRKGLLYLGTENMIYVSLNDGKNWQPLQSNLPHAPAHWLTIQEHFGDLVVSTYGRGFWIMDDITPLRQLTGEVLKSDAFLFAPRPAYRFHRVEGPAVAYNDQCAGTNPPYGAFINYYLKDTPKEEIIVTILDEKGNTVRTLKTEKKEDSGLAAPGRRSRALKIPKKPGINRLTWDLRYDKTKKIKLRTIPPGQDHVRLGPKGWRPFPSGDELSGPLAAPGTYTVKLTIGKKEYLQKLVIYKDPHSSGTLEDIRAQLPVLLDIREMINTIADIIDEAEIIRAQLRDLMELVKDHKEAKEIIAKASELDKKILAIEDFFFATGLAGEGDYLRYAYRFYNRLDALAYGIGSADFPPTTQQLEVYRLFKKQLADYKGRFDALSGKDLPAFNKWLSQKNILHIVIPQSLTNNEN